MSSSVTWMWFGNQPQINSDWRTPATTNEANGIVGYKAFGSDQIKPVDVFGSERKIQTQYGTEYAYAPSYTHDPNGYSVMAYADPATGQAKYTAITGFMQVRYALTQPDGSVVQQTGVLIQMYNGDMFFRPSRDQVAAWSGINELQSVEILSATSLPANTYAAKVSFSPSVYDVQIVCFAGGTMIRTPQGDVAVEDLRPGMMVMTRDAGAQPLRWCGASAVPAAVLQAGDRLRPIRIEAGALGVGMPSAALRVSPQHRVLVSSAIAERMFGTTELLVPAKHLTDLPGVSVDDDLSGVTYHHLMLDAHHILTSNGAPTESLYPGRQALQAIGPDAVAEIEALFPGLLDAAPAPARTLARGPKVRKLAERHAANDHALVG